MGMGTPVGNVFPVEVISNEEEVSRLGVKCFRELLFTGMTVKHTRGDVLIYRNKRTDRRDVIVNAYTDPRVTRQ